MKLSLVLFLAWWLGKKQKASDDPKRQLLIALAVVTPILGLMVVQQDFGTTAIMLSVILILLFTGGTKLLYLAPLPVVGFAGLVIISFLKPERAARWMAFFHSAHSTDPLVIQKMYQQQQALIALGSGGMWGLGLGNSRQKMFWLPEANTDFVFPIIGEELGMIVTLSVVLAFLIITLSAGWITLHAPDKAGVLIGTGVTVMIALQAMMNLAVVTSLMPCKGIPLPFISYGGSNLFVCLAGVGLLFNIHRQGIYSAPKARALVAKAYSVRM